MKIGVFCSSSSRMEPQFYDAARELGEWIGRNGHALVYGGSSCGMMEVVAQAVHQNGGQVFGVVPRRVVEHNLVSDAIDVVFHCEDLNDRKQWLVQESDVMVVLPGSVGTLDEAFTAMASNTFEMHKKKCIFYNIDGFYDLLFAFIDTLESRGVVNKPWDGVYAVANTLEEVEKQLSMNCNQ